jgi:pyruvate dehydrogenase E1 component
MLVDGEDVLYYITLYNENMQQPAMPPGSRQGILDGLYRYRAAPELRKGAPRVQLLGSGPILLQVLDAQQLLAERYGVDADVWSATSYTQLRREALEVERWNRLNPTETPRIPRVTQLLEEAEGPVIAVSDFIAAVPDQIARWVPHEYHSLGTDGFGRSDTRPVLRRHFEIDAPSIVIAALSLLSRKGQIKPKVVAKAIEETGIDPDKRHPARA